MITSESHFQKKEQMSESVEISNVTNSSKEHLEDFEEFDLRDAVNVAAYSLMSASKSLY